MHTNYRGRTACASLPVAVRRICVLHVCSACLCVRHACVFGGGRECCGASPLSWAVDDAQGWKNVRMHGVQVVCRTTLTTPAATGTSLLSPAKTPRLGSGVDGRVPANRLANKLRSAARQDAEAGQGEERSEAYRRGCMAGAHQAVRWRFTRQRFTRQQFTREGAGGASVVFRSVSGACRRRHQRAQRSVRKEESE